MKKILCLAVLSIFAVLIISCGPTTQDNVAADSKENKAAQKEQVQGKQESKPAPAVEAKKESPAPVAASRSRDEILKGLVASAVSFLKTRGQKTLLSEVSNPQGAFVEDNYFVYVLNIKRNGKVIAGKEKSLLNKNVYTKDNNGKLFIKSMVELAESSKDGFLDYKWNNQSRSCYFQKVDNLLIVGSN